MDLKLFSGIYKDRRVLLTGHTGFKGSWLAYWLMRMGAVVAGISLDPSSQPSHWDLLKLKIAADHRQDIREYSEIEKIVKDFQPSIVFHLAAQPLVRSSYNDPLNTWSTNVMGTANILEACRHVHSVRAVVAVTTDKCYENIETDRGYLETDRLGGHDPYSASKAAAELVAASYRKSFSNEGKGPLIATARAGNVIGGGDWAKDRLIPDLARAAGMQSPLVIRSPQSTRPWQHVLEPLTGYLLLGQKLLQGHNEMSDAWNFGPDKTGNQTVEKILEGLKSSWPAVTWRVEEDKKMHEARLLHLDSTKASHKLGWVPAWNPAATLQATATWYRSYLEDNKILTAQQLDEYIADAGKAGMAWAA